MRQIICALCAAADVFARRHRDAAAVLPPLLSPMPPGFDYAFISAFRCRHYIDSASHAFRYARFSTLIIFSFRDGVSAD
jgi:hypothetical protein